MISAAELRAGVARVAEEISAAHVDGVVLISILKGSIPFVADLCRHLTIVPEFDFLAISSYAPDTGRVRIVKDLDTDIHGRHVVVVEDLVDTGLTLGYLLRELDARGPTSLSACALLDKRVRRIVPTPLAHVGFVVPDEFLLGYGLDFDGLYRNLDRVVAGDLEALRRDPGAHVKQLFAG